MGSLLPLWKTAWHDTGSDANPDANPALSYYNGRITVSVFRMSLVRTCTDHCMYFTSLWAVDGVPGLGRFALKGKYCLVQKQRLGVAVFL